MEPDYDVVIVGARPAGSATAILASRRGLRVLLVDRARFPSDIISTSYIHQPGVHRLQRLGVLDDIRDSGCPPIRSTRFSIGGTVIEGGVTPVGGIDEGFAPRRFVLDTIMARHAEASGAHLLQGWTLHGLRRSQGRVDGVTLLSPERESREVTCRLVVGADGKRSKVAQLVGAPVTAEHPKLTCCYYSFWQGMDGGYELYEGDGAWVGCIPSNDATIVAAYFPQAAFRRIRSAPAQAHADAVAAVAPPVAERMKRATRSERFWGTGDQQNFFRRAWGPGWALVGDAGHTKDSITARGITDALLQAEALAGRVWRSIDDPGELDEALAVYGKQRDELLWPGYQGTLDVARLRVDPARLEQIGRIAEDPVLAQQYRDAVAGLRTTEGLGLPSLVANS